MHASCAAHLCRPGLLLLGHLLYSCFCTFIAAADWGLSQLSSHMCSGVFVFIAQLEQARTQFGCCAPVISCACLMDRCILGRLHLTLLFLCKQMVHMSPESIWYNMAS